ncbi:MAG: hypothetical protein IKP72_13565, partial [Clostridia bacterium]|nr:hypothetical protein [Clostridia bacterium]
ISVFGRKMSVSGQFCPKTPFYKKLMKPSKACFSWLSMAGCRLCRHPGADFFRPLFSRILFCNSVFSALNMKGFPCLSRKNPV